jgi:3-oxoacyl-[acyl-carrier protein] reductase
LKAGGYRVMLLGRDGQKLEEAAKKLGGASDHLGFVDCDLRQGAQIRRAVERVAQTSPSPIYGLVNNAGIYPFGGITNTSEAAWDEAMAVNLKAPFLMIQAAVEHMAKARQGGRIVNVSSTAGLLPNHFALAYSVSKGALVHLTKTLAKELGKDGITINSVCPGIVRTAMHEAYHRSDIELEAFYAKRGAAFPLGRVGEPQDVAGAIRYLLSEEAAWVTGDTLVVDGGRLLL